MIKKNVNENGLVADFFMDPTARPGKAIVMLGGSEGGKSWSRIRKPIEMLVQRGYSLLSLAYFKAKGLPNSLQEIPLEYFERAFNWLSSQERVLPDEYAILGGSKGAEAALLLGSKYPQVKAVIAFSPSSVVWQGIPARRFDLGKDVKSSWSFAGKGLPFLTYPASIKSWDLLLLQFRKMHEDALRNASNPTKAAIPVENIQGAILLISGKRDRLWPATPMGEQIMARLQAVDFYPHFEHIAYDSGHNGIIRNRDSWRKIFSFLQAHFPQGVLVDPE